MPYICHFKHTKRFVAAADDIDTQRKHINLLLVDGSLFEALISFEAY